MQNTQTYKKDENEGNKKCNRDAKQIGAKRRKKKIKKTSNYGFPQRSAREIKRQIDVAAGTRGILRMQIFSRVYYAAILS